MTKPSKCAKNSRRMVLPILNKKQIICKNANRYEWDLSRKGYEQCDKKVKEIRLADIKRPLQGSRSNGACNTEPTKSLQKLISNENSIFVDQDKVEALKLSISEHGLLEPIDVLEFEGKYYGFSGCHRFQAHQELGREKILCRIRKATEQTLKFHFM